MAGGSGSQTSVFRVGENVDFFLVMELLIGVVIFVMFFELNLHRMDKTLSRHPKYREMMNKVFGEFMILGFVGLLIKLSKEIFHVDPYSQVMIGLQVADLIVFLVAVGLVVQAFIIFLIVRNKNILLDKADLITSKYLLSIIHQRLTEIKRRRSTPGTVKDNNTAGFELNIKDIPGILNFKVIRYFFLRKYQLPELFPFAQYLRYAENNQINHMIEVQFSTWICLIMVALSLEGVSHLVYEWLGNWDENILALHTKQDAIVVAYIVFTWSLVIAHFLVKYYFDSALNDLVDFTVNASGLPMHDDAGLSSSLILEEKSRRFCKLRPVISNKQYQQLQRIAHVESNALEREDASDAIAALESIRDQRSKMNAKHSHEHGHGDLLHDDVGFQLLRKVFLFIVNCGRLPPSSKLDDAHHVGLHAHDQMLRTTETSEPIGLEHTQIVKDDYVTWKPKMYSRKAWHFVVMTLLMLNAFYFALYCECIVFQLHRIYKEFGLAPVIFIPLPLLINALILQPALFKHFILISSICRFDDAAYGEVVDHLTDTLQLRSEFIVCIKEHMITHGWSRDDLHASIIRHDPNNTGSITIDDMREILAMFGYSLSYFRFNNVVRVLFETRGIYVQYNQVERLLFVGDGLMQDVERVSQASQAIPPTPTFSRMSSRSNRVTQPNSPPSYRGYLKRDSILRRASSRALSHLYNLNHVEGSPSSYRERKSNRSRSGLCDEYVRI